jgi:uncharacterized protein with NRDE domain
LCLVFIGFRLSGDRPVMIGANREEAYRRPTTSPVCCRSGPLRCLLAGADHGPDGTFPEMGTWLGVNETGLIVAVTSRKDGELTWEEQVRSRGLLAVSLLEFDDPQHASRFARDELSKGGFGGSNFLIASPESAFVVHAPGARRVTVRSLSSGVHAITNLDLDDADDPRIRLVRRELDPDQFLTSARSICRREEILIKGDDRGTVSSSLIIVGERIIFQNVLGYPVQAEDELFVLPDDRR